MVGCWMYFEGGVNRISWQDAGCGKKREIKDGSKMFSLNKGKDGITFN